MLDMRRRQGLVTFLGQIPGKRWEYRNTLLPATQTQAHIHTYHITEPLSSVFPTRLRFNLRPRNTNPADAIDLGRLSVPSLPIHPRRWSKPSLTYPHNI